MQKHLSIILTVLYVLLALTFAFVLLLRGVDIANFLGVLAALAPTIGLLWHKRKK